MAKATVKVIVHYGDFDDDLGYLLRYPQRSRTHDGDDRRGVDEGKRSDDEDPKAMRPNGGKMTRNKIANRCE